MDERGVPSPKVARRFGLSRYTIAKHAGAEDLSPDAQRQKGQLPGARVGAPHHPGILRNFRARFRASSRYCNPYSVDEKESFENAVGFLLFHFTESRAVPPPIVEPLPSRRVSHRWASPDERTGAAKLRQGPIQKPPKPRASRT